MARVMVKAIKNVRQTMRKKVAAEFVESEQILNVLKKMKIDLGQGYYLGKPAKTPLPVNLKGD